MTIGERIKARRLEIGMSVDQLAEAIGKNRATVYRYESNDIEKYTIDVLYPLASALRTTPAYLMGWDESGNGNQNKESEHKMATQILSSAGRRKKAPDSMVEALYGKHAFSKVGFKSSEDNAVSRESLTSVETIVHNAESILGGAARTDAIKSKPRKTNMILIAGRDGSLREKHLTDEDLAAVLVLVDRLPDASDDL